MHARARRRMPTKKVLLSHTGRATRKFETERNSGMSCQMPHMSSCECFQRGLAWAATHEQAPILKATLLACDHLAKHVFSPSWTNMPSARATCHRRVRVTWLPDTSLCNHAVHWCEPKSHTKPSCGYKLLIRPIRKDERNFSTGLDIV